MSSTIDRHLARNFAVNTALITTATVVVFVVLDVLLGFHLLTRPAPTPWTKLELFACRLPGLIDFAIPVAAVISVLATVAPMLKRGEFIALGAAGITLPRATRALLAGCLLAGVASVAVADLAAPPATARALALQDLLEGQNREGRVWREADGATWFAGGARLVGVPEPTLTRVVAAAGPLMALADRLEWRGGRWIASQGAVILHVGPGGAQRLERAAPGPLPAALDLAEAPEVLYRRLLPRYTMTGPELLARGERADLAVACGRYARVLLPLLAAMAALAVFVRFANRDRIAIASIRAAGAALLPAGLIIVAGMSADTAPWHPAIAVLAGTAAAALPALWLWLRWRL